MGVFPDKDHLLQTPSRSTWTAQDSEKVDAAINAPGPENIQQVH